MNIIFFSRSLLISTALSMAIIPMNSFALPTGGNVTSGSATISNTASQTTINQASNKAIINWSGFDTSSTEKVQFNQPSASSITLNKINSNTPTTFNGQLNSNGKVWLINTNGMLFGSTAKVNVGGLLATASTINDNDFNTGQYNFTAGGHPFASVRNAGSITVANSGLATLVAPNASNDGTITAKLGKVTLGGGDTFALDTFGDGLISLSVNAGPNLQQVVNNTGTLNATGGSVVLTTGQANTILDNVINLSGYVNADNVTATANNGSVDFGGQYATDSRSTTPGNITLAATHNVTMLDNAKIGNGLKKLNVTFNANKDNTNNGFIYLADGTSIKSGGGNITLGGGNNPLTGYAYGNGITFGWPNLDPQANGITLGNTTINAAGGNIVMNGKGYENPNTLSSSNTRGVFGYSSSNSASITTSGTGSITINGEGGSTGNGLNSTGVELTGFNIATDLGNLSISGFGKNAANSNGVMLYNDTLSTKSGLLNVYGKSAFANLVPSYSNGIAIGYSTLSTDTGGIKVTGDGSAAYDGYGVNIDHSTIKSTGTGRRAAKVEITGTSGLQGTGTYLSNNSFSTVDANVILTGNGYNTGFGPLVNNGNSYTSTGAGTYTFVTNYLK